MCMVYISHVHPAINLTSQCILWECCIKVPISLKNRFFQCWNCVRFVSVQFQRRSAFQPQEFAFSTILVFNVTHRWKLIHERPLKVRFLNAYVFEISRFSVSQRGNWLWMFRFFNVKYANSLYYRPRTDLQQHNFRWKLVLNSSFRNIAH